MPSLTKMANEAKSKSKSKNSTTTNSKSIKKGAPPVTSSSTFKSTEYIADEDESSDDEEEEADSEDGVDEAETVRRVAVTSKVDGKTGVGREDEVDSGSEEEGSEDSSSEEEEDSTSEMDVDEAVEVVNQIAQKSNGTTPQNQTQLSSKPILPSLHPSYKPASIPSSTPASTMFEKSNLAGKQIWYFTAPSTVPVSSIKKISLSEIKRGATAVKVAEQEYGFVEDDAADTTYTRILVPSAGEGGYRASSKPISKVLHLQLLAKVPGVTTCDLAPKATVPTTRPPRAQPKGMKMRFFPIGVRKTTSHREGEEEEEEDETAEFQVHGAIEDSDGDVDMGDGKGAERLGKRKHKGEKKEKEKTKGEKKGDGDVSIEAEAERKRRKKEKKERKLKSAGGVA